MFCLTLQYLNLNKMSDLEFNQSLINNVSYLKPFALNFTKDADKAQDLIQETMHRALVNKDKFNAGTNFKAWTFTIMRNIFINDFRKNSRYKVVYDNTENNSFLDNLKHVANSAEATMGFKEIMGMVEKLPDIFKRPFLLYYYGYQYKDIAAQLMLPLGTIKSRIHFSRRLLKDQISQNNGS